jgi:hypothetical protein
MSKLEAKEKELAATLEQNKQLQKQLEVSTDKVAAYEAAKQQTAQPDVTQSWGAGQTWGNDTSWGTHGWSSDKSITIEED